MTFDIMSFFLLPQSKTAIRLSQPFPCAWRLMAEKMWPSSPKAPWLIFFMESRSSITFPMSWPTPLALAKTKTTAVQPPAPLLSATSPLHWPSFFQLHGFCADLSSLDHLVSYRD